LVWAAGDVLHLAAEAHGRAVPLFVSWLRAVNLLEHRVVDVRAEGVFDRVQIGLMAVGGELYAIPQPSSDILHELVR
jgi:hypothetical protein